MSASPDLARRLVAEVLGTAVLVATVVGSGIMADRLTDDTALALLGNTLPTGAILVVLISILGPVSGAHFNPAVTAVFVARRDLGLGEGMAYAAAQVSGAVVGTMIAHAMFEHTLVVLSATARTGGAQWLSEVVATFTLVAVILGGLKVRPDAIPVLVGLMITAAYWFTASTSFANPAVAIARSLTDTFSGIRRWTSRVSSSRNSSGPSRARPDVLALRALEVRVCPARHSCGVMTLSVTIYHNPACGTSRNTLAMILAAGVEPTVVEYLKTPPDRKTLVDLIGRMGIARAISCARRARPTPTWGSATRP